MLYIKQSDDEVRYENKSVALFAFILGGYTALAILFNKNIESQQSLEPDACEMQQIEGQAANQDCQPETL